MISDYLSTTKAASDLKMSERIAILQEVAEMTVSRFGYIPILEKIFYEKAIIEHCAGIDLFADREFDIDELCSYLIDNRGDVDRIIAKADPDGDLRDACRAAVQYRVDHGTGTSIDYLLDSLSAWIEKASQQEIDPTVIDSLRELIPNLWSMDTADMAKAIIERDPKITAIR